jgi:NTP pyrophosphatase (non-canonical NTP hydrolase)
MEFKEVQRKMSQALMKYGEANRIRISDDFVLLKLYEEVGELAKAALVYKGMARKENLVSREEAKRIMADEMADVAGIIMSLSSIMNIDIEQKIKEKWIDQWLDDEF